MTTVPPQKFRWLTQKIAVHSQVANLSAYFRESLRPFGWKCDDIIPDFRTFLQTLELNPFGAVVLDSNPNESVFEIFMTLGHQPQLILKPVVLLLEAPWAPEAEAIKNIYNVFSVIKPITASKIIDVFKAIHARHANAPYQALMGLDEKIIQFGISKIESFINPAETAKSYKFYTALLRAASFERNKQIKNAEKTLIELAKLFAGNPFLLFTLARFYARHDLHFLALKLLDKLKNLNPLCNFLGYDFALSQTALGLFDAAGEELLKILQRSPEYDFLSNNVAKIFLTNGRFIELSHQFPDKKARLQNAINEWDALENL